MFFFYFQKSRTVMLQTLCTLQDMVHLSDQFLNGHHNVLIKYKWMNDG